MSKRKQSEGGSENKKVALSDRNPRPPASIASSNTVSSDGGSASRRRSNSNVPSRSATNDGGEKQLNNYLRSILCHPLGLPLACALHGKDPGRLDYLRKKSSYFPNNTFDKFLGKVLAARRTKGEKVLTKSLANAIDGNKSIPLRAESEAKMGDGRVDILIRKNNEESRALMLLEVGTNGNDWWLKFDQCLKYLNKIQQAEPPLLLGVMTVEEWKMKTADKSQRQQIEVKLGVFLCLWSGEEDNNNKKKIRISLLWHSKTCNRGDASKAFGRLLRGVCDFSTWIQRVDREPNDSQYEYFGSNCCKVDNMVLRSYDNRYRKTHRSPDIYLDEDCEDIVGEGVKIIFEVSSPSNASDDFWELSGNRSLRVIATPFRPGDHVAKEPKSFLPIIDHLEMLHQKGYVHGDIRGFNTVFGDDSSQGYLIDFDFGGEAEKRVYPNGYRTDLRDGKRIGDEGEYICKWHDWWALGCLIFDIHTLKQPDGRSQSISSDQYVDLCNRWKELSNDPTPEMIVELKNFLSTSQDAGWKVQTSLNYRKELKKLEKSHQASKPCATGSPP